jgi:hypothetical protein
LQKICRIELLIKTLLKLVARDGSKDKEQRQGRVGKRIPEGLADKGQGGEVQPMGRKILRRTVSRTCLDLELITA